MFSHPSKVLFLALVSYLLVVIHCHVEEHVSNHDHHHVHEHNDHDHGHGDIHEHDDDVKSSSASCTENEATWQVWFLFVNCNINNKQWNEFAKSKAIRSCVICLIVIILAQFFNRNYFLNHL